MATWPHGPMHSQPRMLHRRSRQGCVAARASAQRKTPAGMRPQVIRSADLISYTAEEGVRALGEGKLLASDSFPGNTRNKLCMVAKVRGAQTGQSGCDSYRGAQARLGPEGPCLIVLTG